MVQKPPGTPSDRMSSVPPASPRSQLKGGFRDVRAGSAVEERAARTAEVPETIHRTKTAQKTMS